MSNWWGNIMESKRWSNAGLVFLAVLAVVLIAANVIQNREREAAVLAGQSTTAATTVPTTHAAQPGALFFGDSYFNSADGGRRGMAFLAGEQLGYASAIGGFGGTGFVAARTVEPPTPNYIAQLDAGALSKLDPATIRLVVVEGGLNDLGEPDDQVTRNAVTVLGRMVQAFPGAKVVLLGPVATTGIATRSQKDVVIALTEAAKTANVPFIDATSWITPDNVGSIIGPDKVHPTDDGHKALAEQLAKALRDLGLAAQ